MRWARRTLLRILSQWQLIAAACVAAAIIHIIATLSVSRTEHSLSIARLSQGLPDNTVVVLPPITTNAHPLPFLAPDARYALCLFDATASLIRVSTVLPETGWSLSLHAPNGDNFYFVPGIDGRETNVELQLRPPGGRFLSNDVEVVRGERLVPEVNLPAPRGLAILKAPTKGLAYRRQVDEQLSAFRCGSVIQGRRRDRR